MIFYQDVDCTLTVNTDLKKKMRMITRKLIDREWGYCITKRNVTCGMSTPKVFFNGIFFDSLR